MSMNTPLKVFWSWQSDSNQAGGKLFVRQVLQELAQELSASTLEEAERPENEITSEEVQIDHDRLGEPGTPKLAETILRKISEAAVFVADVTLTGTTKGGKHLCNSNVMIELGYAMRVLGNDRIILVMNLAEGGKPDNLPFDLRHWSWPIRYTLSKNADDEDRAVAARKLKDDIRPLLQASLVAGGATLREEQRRTHRGPNLLIGVDQNGSSLSRYRISQDHRALPAKTIEEVRTETPLLPIPDRTQPGSGRLGHRSPFGRSPPPRFWTPEETEGYNAFVVFYHRKWIDYLTALQEHDLLEQRTFEVRLFLVNAGTAPGTGIDATITFPDHVRLYSAATLPEPPEPPEPPPLMPLGAGQAFIRQVPPSFDIFDHIADINPGFEIDGQIVKISERSLKHNDFAALPTFFVSFAKAADLRTFKASYRIIAQEPIDPIVGEVTFEIQTEHE